MTMVHEKTMTILEKYFSVKKTRDNELELEKWTDGGVDMFIYVNVDNVIDDFCEYAEDFDIDEEIEVHRQDKRYCSAFSIKESVEDFEKYKVLIETIAEELRGNAPLESEINSSEAEDEIMRLANPHAVFEHGQWWLKVAGRTFAVVDTISGFDFEDV